jgi:hypothetical protein
METSGMDISEDRIMALEQKVPEMEALVKGLMAELLDVKALVTSMFKEAEERSRQELKREPVVQGTSAYEQADHPASPFVAVSSNDNTVIRPRVAYPSGVPVAMEEPKMVMIMQTDGTMKLEPRYGEAKHIDSTGGYGRNKKDVSVKSKQNPLIYAAEKDKPGPAKV